MRTLIKQTAQSIAYAQHALSFVFLDASLVSLIRTIYIYGSAVRGELDKQSDIDLFVDCDPTHQADVEKRVRAAFLRFSQSRDYEKWSQLGFSYPISIFAGDLAEWELKTSIMAEGIVLYSKQPHRFPSERFILFTLALPSNKKKYLLLTRSLFGRKEKMVHDGGLLGSVHGQKISSHVFLVPKEHQRTVLQFLAKEKADYSLKEICVFE